MKIFIWKYINNLTDNYHSGGGLVVIAETEAKARKKAIKAMRKDCYSQRTAEECTIFPDEKPNLILSIKGLPEGSREVFIFPDAGCC